MLQKETDASPRGFMLEFDADAPGIEYRVERIRRLRGWPQWDFKLHSFVRDGMLGFSGVEPESLPDGRYWFRLRLADLVVPKRKFKLTIPKDGEVIQSIDVKQDPRRIEQADFSTMDAKVRTILENNTSQVDGDLLSAWIHNVSIERDELRIRPRTHRSHPPDMQEAG